MSFLLDQRKNDIFNRAAPQVSGPQQMPTQMAMPSGGPNVGQPMPAPDPTANAAAGPLGWSGGQYQPGTALPSGGTPIPFLNGGGQQGTPGLQPAQFRHQFQQAGISPSSMLDQLNAQRSPPSGLSAMFAGGGMAPSMPNAVDQGIGMQQMNHGNPMGGMNNWFSNFTAPRPMPAPAPAAPAPMMPMKGMFGVR